MFIHLTFRLLWDIGAHVAYFPPNAYQDRTPHDFLKDFLDEDDLYRKVHPFVHLLNTWKGSSDSMLQRHFQLFKAVHKGGILGIY